MNNAKRNGKFLMILPVGLYVVNIESNGFELYSQDLYVAGEDLYVSKDYKTFKLKKIGSTEESLPVDLKNEKKDNNILPDNKKSVGEKNDNSKIGTDKIASPKKSIPKENKPKK